jgi:hypothetical protein
MHRLHIPEYVYLCHAADGVVFLDARHDRYFSLSGRRVALLANVVENWPQAPAANAPADSVSQCDLANMTRVLLERKLLVKTAGALPSRMRPTAPPLAVMSLQRTTRGCRSGGFVGLVNFMIACSKAAWNLRRKSLELIAREVTAARSANNSRAAVDGEEAVQLTQLFWSFRRFFFSEKNRCLLNALSLVYFLRNYGHFPMWVIGVRAAPFTAHSWVQDGPIALDGDPTLICHYVPILVA